MKKLKLRGKEPKKLGYADDRAISLALNIVRKHFKRGDEIEILNILQNVLLEPEKFRKDKNLGSLAALFLQEPKKSSPSKKVSFKNKPIDFLIYGKEFIDPEALRQMETAMKLPISVKGALMADAHVGYGLPIGGVVAAYNAVMPYGVGMDIGCRMCLSVYSLSPKIIKGQRDRLKNILIENTRFGLAEFNDIGDHELMERHEFKEIKFLESLRKKFYRQLGTSGHGNHFVEIGHVEIEERSEELGLDKGTYFAVLSHSGSRSFGAEIARHYTKLAQEKLGITGEGAQLAWLKLDTEEGQEYWRAMTLAGDYSAANHRIIHSKLSKALGEKPIKIVENHHNFAWKEKLSESETLIVHRKGATPAKVGDTGIIPGNMISPAFIVAGKSNPDSLNSASHGAGRVISRKKAKNTFTKSALNKLLVKSEVELIGGDIDESPMAYKDIFQVMDAQKDLVKILGKFYPKIVRME